MAVLKSVIAIFNRAFDSANNRLKVSVEANPASGTPGSLGNGRKVVAAAGTPEALATTTTCRYVILTALRTNTDVVSVGGSGVIAASGTRTGIPLSPGQQVSIEIDNLADVFVDSVVNGEGVAYAYSV